MRPAFVDHPVTAGILAISLLVWVALETRQALQHRTGSVDRDRDSMALLRLTTLTGVVLAALALNLAAVNFELSVAVSALGLAFVWVGIGRRAWCFSTLGRYFTYTVQTSVDQPLITSGPYRWLRHPSYLGLILIVGGIGLLYGNALSVAAMVGGLLIGLLYRIRVEEAALRAAAGPAFEVYARGRKRLLPLVW